MIEVKQIPTSLRTEASIVNPLRTSIGKEIRATPEAFVRQKLTGRGNTTYCLTGEGRSKAKAVYEEVKATAPQLRDAAREIGSGISVELKDLRKQTRINLSQEWEASGKKRRANAQEFRSELKQRIQKDPRFQEAQATRRILASVVQRAKLEEARDLREQFKAEISPHDPRLEVFRETLTQRGKHIPLNLVRNAFIETLIKQERAKLEVDEQQAVKAAENIIRQQKEVQREALQQEQALQRAREEAAIEARRRDLVRLQREEANRKAAMLTTELRQHQQARGKSIAKRLEAFGFGVEEVVGNIASMFSSKQKIAIAGLASVTLAAYLGISRLPMPSSTPPPAPPAIERSMQKPLPPVNLPVSPVGPLILKTFPAEASQPLTESVRSRPVDKRDFEKTPKAHATFAEGAIAKAFVPGTNREANIDPKARFEIVGYGQKEFTFLVYDPITKQHVEAPILNMEVKGKLPWKTKQYPLIGISSNEANDMHLATELGASKVRIDIQDGDLEKHPEAKAAILSAKKEHLRPLLVFNPGKPLSEKELRHRLQGLAALSDEYDVEWGNEADNDVVTFWEGRNLRTVAKFAATGIRMNQEINPNSGNVIGALVYPDRNQVTLVSYLEQEGLDPSTLVFAAHAYQTPENVVKAGNAIKRAIKGGRIRWTELGVGKAYDGSGDKRNLIPMLNEGLMFNPVGVDFFGLGNAPFDTNASGGDPGFYGLVWQGEPEAIYYYLQRGLALKFTPNAFPS